MMKRSLTADDVLSDIEFELAQGAISRNELGQAVQALRRHQNEMRREILESSENLEGREVISRLFQLNDMMLTLLQGTAAAIQSLRLDLRNVARLATRSRTTRGSVSSAEVVKREDLDLTASTAATTAGLEGTVCEQVRNGMRSEAVEVEMNVRPGRMPIIGSIVKRLRITLHSMALFYVNRFGERQVVVNQSYGDAILRLVDAYEQQQEQINRLHAQMASLRAGLNEADE